MHTKRNISIAATPATGRTALGGPPRFTTGTLRFLRALKRNNDREWFRARRDEYERAVRGPMIAVIEQLAVDFAGFAPELIASPKASLYRIYRDTRFSEDKSPLKTQISASFRWRGLPKGGGAGLYLEVNPGWVWMGGGFYAPEAPHLVRIREHLSTTYPEIHRLVRKPAFTQAVGSLDGERLTRVPRGFAKEDPSAEYLKYKHYLAGREFPPDFATSAAFYPTLVRTFKAIMPLVRFLNEPLDGEPGAAS
jgi:uncharacterized protein (TIGR02453 family)